MAKTSMVMREVKRAKLVARYAARRAQLKAVIGNLESTDEERQVAVAKLAGLPRDSEPCTATVVFTIRPCPDLPASLEVQVPVDTIAPGSGGGVVGEADFLPGEEPINEVRGAREPGPAANSPLPPSTGNTVSTASSSSSISLLLLVTGAAVMSLSPLAWSASRASGRLKR